MTVEVLNKQQVANQEQVTHLVTAKRVTQLKDKRTTVLAVFLALIVIQGINLFFASPPTRCAILQCSKTAARTVEIFLDELVKLGARCEATGNSSLLCPLYTRVRALNEYAVIKERSSGPQSEDVLTEMIHVIQTQNLSSLVGEDIVKGVEGNDYTTTLVKTASDEEIVAKHPILRFALHSPFFLQIILPSLITIFAMLTVKFVPGSRNGTVTMAYFMLVSFFFARLFLQLY